HGGGRVLGPLAPLLGAGKLVAHAFGFDYIWEVYKPAALRRWGWYVCPLLVGDRLVGRIDGAIDGEACHVRKSWREPKQRQRLDEAALDAALDRHARACGATKVIRPKG